MEQASLCLPFPFPEATASPLCPNQPFIFWRPRSSLKGIHSFSTRHSQKAAGSYTRGSHCPACGSKHLSAPRVGVCHAARPPACRAGRPPGAGAGPALLRRRSTRRPVLRELCSPRSSFTAKPCFLQSSGSWTCAPKSRQWMVTQEGLCAASPPGSGASQGQLEITSAGSRVGGFGPVGADPGVSRSRKQQANMPRFACCSPFQNEKARSWPGWGGKTHTATFSKSKGEFCLHPYFWQS